VNKGANMTMKNNEGKSALTLARENNHQSIVTFFRKRMKKT
jgi:hypothetical protein